MSLESVVPLSVLELETNTGGAGGFHAGLAEALRRDADLVWLMDDDGTPAPDCLELLLPSVVEADGFRGDFVGPAVVAEHDPTRLCFPIRLPGRSTVVHALADVERAASDGLLVDVVIPFNGVLLTRGLVERIGLVREEFFIWGDDVEYLWRARACRGPDRHRRGGTVRPSRDGRPRHTLDVRADDVQPLAVRPQALLHVPQQRRQPA